MYAESQKACESSCGLWRSMDEDCGTPESDRVLEWGWAMARRLLHVLLPTSTASTAALLMATRRRDEDREWRGLDGLRLDTWTSRPHSEHEHTEAPSVAPRCRAGVSFFVIAGEFYFVSGTRHESARRIINILHRHEPGVANAIVCRYVRAVRPLRSRIRFSTGRSAHARPVGLVYVWLLSLLIRS